MEEGNKGQGLVDCGLTVVRGGGWMAHLQAPPILPCGWIGFSPIQEEDLILGAHTLASSFLSQNTSFEILSPVGRMLEHI